MAPRKDRTHETMTEGALGNVAGENLDPGDQEMPENGHAMHQGLHDGVEADLHFGEESDASIHDEDAAEENWKEPSPLDAPDPRPGFRQRWIRLSLIGKIDAKNQSTQGQVGWKPRALSSVPVGERGRLPTIKDRRTGGEYMISGDLILCEMTEGRFLQIQKHYRDKSRKQVNALRDDLARAAIPGSDRHGIHAPEIVERSSKVTTRKPIVQAD